jgi:hypothetical protein
MVPALRIAMDALFDTKVDMLTHKKLDERKSDDDEVFLEGVSDVSEEQGTPKSKNASIP